MTLDEDEWVLKLQDSGRPAVHAGKSSRGERQCYVDMSLYEHGIFTHAVGSYLAQGFDALMPKNPKMKYIGS